MSLDQKFIDDLNERLTSDVGGTAIPVPISYDIIRLFSEGLYQSPHKAVEELVANSFDAGAQLVSVVVPSSESDGAADGLLWVVDDGCGMNDEGFRQLWRVADSPKAGGEEQNGRNPIGQFGIGKLAAYVLAWRLIHISKSADGEFRYASMNFRAVTGSLNDPDAEPVQVRLHQITETEAKVLLQEIEVADPIMWSRLFGDTAATTWTAAGLQDFRELFKKLRVGRLGWVLRTGLPLVSNFTIHLNGAELEPSKADGHVLLDVVLGEQADRSAGELGLVTRDGGVVIPGIDGVIRGTATVFRDSLTAGKSTEQGRSHGFFVRVRGRVINLDDQLFGLDAMNHAAWARFAMEIEADGLREHLLSSREGVRDSEPLTILREYMRGCFNMCRVAYDHDSKRGLDEIEIDSILDKNPSPFLVDALVGAIRSDVMEETGGLYYLRTPEVAADEAEAWLKQTEGRLREQAFSDFEVAAGEPPGQLCVFDAKTGPLSLNKGHPVGARLVTHAKNDLPAKLVAASEIMTYALLRTSGLEGYAVHEFFQNRDQILRRLAGEETMDVASVIRHLQVANEDDVAMERAVGRGFEIMGFDYEPAGGSGRPDGIVRARLGRGLDGSRDFGIVYDAKTSGRDAIPAGKVDIQALLTFAEEEKAEFSLVVGHSFEGQDDSEAALNKRIRSSVDNGNCVTALLTEDLITLVKLHYRFGLTFPELRSLFEEAHTIPETRKQVRLLQETLESRGELPLRELLDALEREQEDEHSRPQINAARRNNLALTGHTPDHLHGALKAVSELLGERWIDVDDQGYVRMEQSAAEISQELRRRLADDLEIELQSMVSST
ncbi:MAG: ATP-binding protein [Chloroflexi bacterium]|nr:ATP-binding protein [Chloroflexota bacterium]